MSYECILGDCRDVMATMPANSIDSIICDPPYALTNRVADVLYCESCGRVMGGRDGKPEQCPRCGAGLVRRRQQVGAGFMGKDWDTGDVAFQPAIWAEALRVAKPGAFLLAFGGTRTHHRLMCAIEDAGWEIRDCLMWLYGSGFPKSHDISKAIDKMAPRAGMFDAFAQHYKERRIAQGLKHSYVCAVGGFYAEHNHGGASVNWESGYNVPTREQWRVLQPLLGLSPEWVPLIERIEAEREVLRQQQQGRLAVAPGQGMDRSAVTLDITAPATDAARTWDGWGTALKPAWEPIIMAMKPLDGTFANNALVHGVAGINVDGCRIPSSDVVGASGHWGFSTDKGWNQNSVESKTQDTFKHTNGRWPSNVLLDEEAAALLDEQSGERKSGGADKRQRKHKKYESGVAVRAYDNPIDYVCEPSTGGASRFFYVSKASSRERHSGTEDLITWDSVGLNQETEQLLQLAKGISDDTMHLLEGNEWSMMLSGSNITGQFQRDFNHIISILIRLITELRTCNYSPSSNTKGCILAAIREMTADGLNLAESVESLSQLTPTSTKGQGASLPGAVNAALTMLLQISAKGRRGNIHNTVKPIELMRYLCRLTKTPFGGTVLDPFCGSGSTGVAAIKEGRSFIGIDISAEYLAIANPRLQDAAAQPFLLEVA